MNRITLWLLTAALLSLPASLPAQTAKSAKTAKNHRYTIVVPDAGRSAASLKASRNLANSVAKGLAQKGFVRVRQLDVQCCTLQLELVNPPVAGTPVTARLTLLDVDKQNVYSHEYSGQSPELVKDVLADDKMLKALSGT